MKTFGIRISVVLLIFINFHLVSFSQLKCPCQRSLCGDIIASFKLGGNLTEVCDGHEFEVINNSTIPDVSYYIWDWGDGSRDSVTNTNPVKHRFNIPLDLVCNDTRSTYEICLLAVKNCTGNSYSCHTNRSPVTVIHRPLAKFDYTNSICIDKQVNFINMSCNVDESLNDNFYLWEFPDGTTSNERSPSKQFTMTGSQQISLTAKNGCGTHKITQTIFVVDYPDAVVDISATAKDSVVCVGDRITLIDKSNQWALNNKWTYPSNKNPHVEKNDWHVLTSILKKDSLSVGLKDSVHFVDTVIIEMLRVGTYTFKLTSTNACGTREWIFPCKVVEAPTINLQSPPEYCETASYTPSVTVSGEVISYLWTFSGGLPASSTLKTPGTITYNSSGNFLVTLRVIAPCDTIIRTTTVVVNSKSPVNIIDPQKVFCKSSSPDTLKVDRIGGTWAGPGIINSQLGVFDPSNLVAGNYRIIYSIGPANCKSEDTINIQVVNSDTVEVLPLTLCEDSDPRILIANPSGGNWSGNGIINSSGLFNPDSSGIGIHTISYNYIDVNNCEINKTTQVTVEAFPTLSIIDTALLCIGNGIVDLAEILQVTSNPNGGRDSFLINNISVNQNLDLSTYGTGELNAEVFYIRNACKVSDQAVIKFIEKPIVSISPDTIVCIDNFLQLTSNVIGGKWIGKGIDMNTGIIDLQIAEEGNHSYTYEFQKGTSCEQVLTTNVTIKDPGEGLSLTGIHSACFGLASTSIIASKPGGTWTGIGINVVSGVIDLTLLNTDTTYTYQYCLGEVGLNDCTSCRDFTFILYSLPEAAFDIDGTFCIGEEVTFINNSNNYNPNKVKWNFGDNNSSTQDSIATNVYNTKGTFTVSLEIENDNGCENMIQQQLYVTTKPVPDFALIEPNSNCAPFPISAINNSTGDNINSVWMVNGITFNTNNLSEIILDSITDDTEFIIQLEVSNECGPTYFSDTVIVKPYPLADFGVDSLQGCSPLENGFANVTIGNADSYFWDFGNGNSSIEKNPTKQTYTTGDSVSYYTINLIATNECGTDSVEKIITVFPPDVSAFIQSPVSFTCQYDSLNYIAYSTEGSTNTWKIISPIGVITGAAGDTATIVFDNAGRYEIILFASRCGADSDTTYVDVKPAPILDFKIPEFVCLNDSVFFQNLSAGIGGSTWDFGDNNFSTITNPIHKYKVPGVYTISLTAYSLIDNCPFTLKKSILVVGIPKAAFNADSINGCQPLKVNFSNQSLSAIKYDWNFGDNTSHSDLKDPSHTYETSGIFKASLKVYDSYNCFTDTSILNIVVHPKPIADFSFENKKYCLGFDTIHFVNESDGAVSYVWKYNNRDSITTDIDVWPSTIGLFSISLISISDFGCRDTFVNTLSILPSPIAGYKSDKISGCEDLLVTFTNESEYGDRFIWNFGNNNTSVNRDTSYLYSTHGLYNVSLIAINDNGCPNDTSVTTINVYPKPIADFTSTKDMECGVPMNVKFDNKSQLYKDSEWLVDGINFSQDESSAYTFNEDKKYTVTLHVENEYNCKDTSIQNVEIYHQPKAEFSILEEACEGDEVVFENLSTNATFYEWNIEGKGTSSAVSPSVTFDESGSFDISLIAAYNELCKDTFSTNVPITIYDSPTADFSYVTGYNNDVKGEVQFTNLSIDFDRLFWDFGDGYFSDSINPMHEYDLNRPIEVELKAYNDNGGLFTCIDSITKNIEPEWIKTFFAPNALAPEYGDELIRVFKPVGRGIKTYKIAIYSPWGEMVWLSTKIDFEKGSPIESWDGRYKGEIVPQGAFSWRADIEWEDGTSIVFVGSVTVLR